MAAIIDKALEQRHRDGRPIRIALIGAGFMARGIALQISTACHGIRVMAIVSRNRTAAERAALDAGLQEVRTIGSKRELSRVAAAGGTAVTDDWRLVCESDEIDAIVEATGSISYAAEVALASIGAGKHLVLMNAELDGTVGPILAQLANEAGVIFTNVDGDQPGVIMNLYRFVKGIGLRPVLCGNVKGLHDPYRNPTTQAEFARKWGQAAHMVTSFADGTKVSFEQAIVANATGMSVARRGMLGPSVEPGTPIERAVQAFPTERLTYGPPIVDYVVGATPSPGIFVLGTIENPVQRRYLELYKLGSGPLYCFSTPFHLCHFEVPNTIARAVLFGDATIAPIGGPRVEVVAAMKTAQRAGTILDGIGQFMTYGLCENAAVVRQNRLLPIGVAEGCCLRTDVPRDHVLTYDDVILPADRMIDSLRSRQESLFQGASRHPGGQRDGSSRALNSVRRGDHAAAGSETVSADV
ncbi:MAG: NAD(P)H-dependent oxidoreductase [Reyranellaceae bacterium]